MFISVVHILACVMGVVAFSDGDTVAVNDFSGRGIIGALKSNGTDDVVGDGAILVPVRAISEVLGKNMDWDVMSSTVIITGKR